MNRHVRYASKPVWHDATLVTHASCLILLAGLTAADDPPLAKICPHLSRLATVGATGSWQAAPSVVAAIRKILFPDGSEKPFPWGYLTALGAGIAPDPEQTWALMDLAHLRQQRDRLLFLTHDLCHVAPEERAQLLESMHLPLYESGWQRHPLADPAYPVLISARRSWHVSSMHWEQLDHRSFFDLQPTGPDALELLALITHGQMVLARHLLNRQRQQTGKPALNTPWIWGVGTGKAWKTDREVTSGWGVATRTDWVGVAMAAGFTTVAWPAVPTGADFASTLAHWSTADPGPGLVMVHTPQVLWRQGKKAERLAWLQAWDREFLSPLTRLLARSHGTLSVIGDHADPGDEKGVVWVTAQGRALTARRWFWQPMRPVGAETTGSSMDEEALRRIWLA
ncbi:MAG: hypothetical protein G8237_10880 [Magnetococcales bacterium]|nr:hypothetical protein [Magnetococcales bacterium]